MRPGPWSGSIIPHARRYADKKLVSSVLLESGKVEDQDQSPPLPSFSQQGKERVTPLTPLAKAEEAGGEVLQSPPKRMQCGTEGRSCMNLGSRWRVQVAAIAALLQKIRERS